MDFDLTTTEAVAAVIAVAAAIPAAVLLGALISRLGLSKGPFDLLFGLPELPEEQKNTQPKTRGRCNQEYRACVNQARGKGKKDIAAGGGVSLTVVLAAAVFLSAGALAVIGGAVVAGYGLWGSGVNDEVAGKIAVCEFAKIDCLDAATGP